MAVISCKLGIQLEQIKTAGKVKEIQPKIDELMDFAENLAEKSQSIKV
jgi:hypothetical protein